MQPVARSGEFGDRLVAGILRKMDENLCSHHWAVLVYSYFDYFLPLYYPSWGLKNSISSY